jgi:hypothetical protein
MTFRAASRAICGLVLSAALAACGGGSGGGGGGNNADPLDIASSELPDGVVGANYGATISVTGGAGTTTFSVTGELPAGLDLDTSAGTIAGTPNGPAGSTEFTISVTDSGSPVQTDTQEFTIRIADPLEVDIGSPPAVTIGTAYSHTIQASGGTPPYFFSINLPSGLSIDEDGVISGMPAPDAVTRDTLVQVLDSAIPPQLFETNVRFAVTLEVATAAMPDATGGVSYSESVMAQGGLPEYNWEMTGGALPNGLLDVFSNGTVNGTPDASCDPISSSFDVRVTDSDEPPQAATRQGITLTVVPGELAIPPTAALPVAVVGTEYQFQVTILPGVDPYTFAIINGSLPSQLTLDASTGRISGTPDAAGTHAFTVQVSDDCGTTVSRAFNIIVRDLPQGRNDSIFTATQLGNGVFLASISPSGEPNSVFSPDEDYYAITAFAASKVAVQLRAQSGQIGQLDTVMEILDANGNRLASCIAPDFSSPCVNDDEIPGLILDSFLEIQVNGPTEFYVHVAEWRGDARPDLQYTIEISGVN